MGENSLEVTQLKAMEKRYDEKAANFTLVESWRPPAVRVVAD